MRTRTRLLLPLALAAVLAACGGPAEPGGDVGSGGAGGGTDSNPGDPAGGTCLVGTDCTDTPGLDPGPDEDVDPDIEVVDEPPFPARIVVPRPVVDELTPVFLQWAVVDGAAVTVGYLAGVEPCFVAAEVVVSELTDVVAITVLGGPDRDAGDVACIEIAEAMAVEVELSAPLGDRRLVDGGRASADDLGA